MSQIYYADSSVLVKRHIHEIGTDWLLELLTPTTNSSITTSTLSIVEALSEVVLKGGTRVLLRFYSFC